MTAGNVLKFLSVINVVLVFQGFVVSGHNITLGEAAEEACRLGLVDASTRTEDGSTYLFKGELYWKIVHGGVAYGYPRFIAEDWQGLGSGIIDAAFTWNDGSTFFFKGDQYWRFVNRNPEEGYPKKINEGFQGIPDNVDAALVWQNNGITYFFKGEKYWRYEPLAVVPTNGDYPAPISSWKGVPNYVDAAIRWEGGLTYFFKGTQYYKYDNNAERVPGNYPVASGPGWFECKKRPTVTEVDPFERQRFNKTQSELTNLQKKIDRFQDTLTQIYATQNLTLSKINDLKQQTEQREPLESNIENTAQVETQTTLDEISVEKRRSLLSKINAIMDDKY